MNNNQKITTIKSFKAQYLPNHFEQENRLLREKNIDYGSYIAELILSGIERDLKALKKKNDYKFKSN